MVFYTSWFLITREIQPVIVVGGHLIGEILNKIIKKIIKEPRPDFHKDFGVGSYSLTYGMPLAHSQFMGYFAAYFVCILLYRVPMNHVRRYIGCGVIACMSVLVALSRVYLLYHTVAQVCVGLLVGALLGLVYYAATELARDVGLVDWVLSWRIVRFFHVKDSYYHCYTTFAEEFAEVERKKAKGNGKEKSN